MRNNQLYIIDGKIVREAFSTKKPYCTTTYTCISSTTNYEVGVARGTSSTTQYTTTSWESRMSTYQRVTTIKQYDDNVEYTYTKQITSTRVDSYTVTNSCCCNHGCCDCNYETNILTGGVDTISTTTKVYDRYKEYKTITKSIETNSLYEEIEEETSYRTFIAESLTANKSWIYSTTWLNPESKKELCSECNTEQITYSSSGYSSESEYPFTRTTSYTEEDTILSSYITSSTQTISTENFIPKGRTYMYLSSSTSASESTIITETITIPDYYTEYSSQLTSIQKSETYTVNSTKISYVVDTISKTSTYKDFYSTSVEYVSSYWTTSSEIKDTVIYSTTFEKETVECCTTCCCNSKTKCKCK